ncbi:MAG TPA: hypothetical protein VGK31_05680 [Thermoanaerobaculia bacterium]|jgi:hypothetical protein
MEDIRPYRNEDDERDETPSDNAVDWEFARVTSDEEVPFHVPRD